MPRESHCPVTGAESEGSSMSPLFTRAVVNMDPRRLYVTLKRLSDQTIRESVRGRATATPGKRLLSSRRKRINCKQVPGGGAGGTPTTGLLEVTGGDSGVLLNGDITKVSQGGRERLNVGNICEVNRGGGD